MNKLVEAYKNKLAIADQAYGQTHNGATLSESKKVMLATLLNNVNKRMNEAFSGSLATQRSGMGEWKKFCLALTTVAVPNLIAEELVLTYPMTSIHGYVAYTKYSYGITKGDAVKGTVIRDAIHGFKNIDPNYTSRAVVETVTAAADVELGFHPLLNVRLVGAPSGAEIEILDAETGHVKITGVSGQVRVAYEYDNEVIPQKTIPTLVASIDGISLHAKARRIGVLYSQMAAYEAKNDYGFDLPDQLSKQAVGELAYEIDTEVVNLLAENAEFGQGIEFNIACPVGVGIRDHYVGFLKVIADAKTIVYKKTQKVRPNFMVCAPDVEACLQIMEAYKASGNEKVMGPYKSGALNGMPVFVHPALEEGTFFLGTNTGDATATAAVFAPYMPIIPSSLIDWPDGSTMQGWASMYDLQILNKDLLVAGRIVNEAQIVETHAN
jgi:hypothetical protein